MFRSKLSSSSVQKAKYCKSEFRRIICSITPQQYNKKTVKIGQGLDFLKFWGGKWRETK